MIDDRPPEESLSWVLFAMLLILLTLATAGGVLLAIALGGGPQ